MKHSGRALAGALALGATLASGCGGGSGAGPSGPSKPAPSDLTGTWAEATGADLTWRLAQSGTSVTGTSAFSQNNGPYLGAVSGKGVITGTISATTFSLTDTYATLSRPNCSMTVTADMTISGSTMTGVYHETDTCDGAVLGTSARGFTMRKQ